MNRVEIFELNSDSLLDHIDGLVALLNQLLEATLEVCNQSTELLVAVLRNQILVLGVRSLRFADALLVGLDDLLDDSVDVVEVFWQNWLFFRGFLSAHFGFFRETILDGVFEDKVDELVLLAQTDVISGLVLVRAEDFNCGRANDVVLLGQFAVFHHVDCAKLDVCVGEGRVGLGCLELG